MDSFELKPSKRINKDIDSVNPEIVGSNHTEINKSDAIVNSIANNFPKILDIVCDIVEIQKRKTESEAIIKKMEEDRKMLLAETEAYVKRKQADTHQILGKMEIIREMMKDFYQHAPSNLTGDEFSEIITKFIDKLDKI